MNPLIRRILIGLGAVVLLLVMLVGGLWAKPLNVAALEPAPQPLSNYDAAAARIAAIQAEEAANDAINPQCHSRAFLHDEPTAHAIVFVHGYTNCPQQFAIIGEMLFDQGYNVYLPRMPYHGLAQRVNDELARLRAEELVAYGTDAVDIAAALGGEVVIGGLSGGAVLAGWIAEQHPAVDEVILIAPGIGSQVVPAVFNRPVTNLLTTAPNVDVWWDGDLKEAAPGPPYAYPRYATRATGAFFRLGEALLVEARRGNDASLRVLLVTNADDPVVNNREIDTLLARWRRNPNYTIQTYQFSHQLELNHDLIDPNQPDQQVDAVYPTLIELIESLDAERRPPAQTG